MLQVRILRPSGKQGFRIDVVHTLAFRDGAEPDPMVLGAFGRVAELAEVVVNESLLKSTRLRPLPAKGSRFQSQLLATSPVLGCLAIDTLPRDLGFGAFVQHAMVSVPFRVRSPYPILDSFSDKFLDGW